ncbi:MAG TPA: O-antigen ligase family protein [Bacteroidales bacterium]|nr:O-antigen ligase family protein [Bacteroidales bacterium]
MKPNVKAPPPKKAPLRTQTYNPATGLILLAYILIPTYTPNLQAFDTNAPKFAAMALVNLAAFIVLLTQKKILRQPGALTFFFRTGIGWVYTGFLAMTLLSFLSAINLNEALLQFVKVFTVFSAVYILAVIILQDMRYLKWVVIVFTAMLILDSLSVFYYIGQFVNGKITSITDIKTIYSNKNILASAVFVKLPFALWLMLFGHAWLKRLGWFGFAAGVTAVFFMATRAFYLGLIILSVLVLAYQVILYFRTKQKTHVLQAGSYAAALLVAYLAFTGTHELLYPKARSSGRLTQGVGAQLATISTSDASILARLEAWNWSWKMIKENPLLGVGTGNWKIAELRYENRTDGDFVYTYKNHNDFIEITAETGIIGGLLYVGIFAWIAWAFLRRFFSRKLVEEDDQYRYLFLAAAGIAFYSVDAFFNFPADRPEILALFAFFAATGIVMIHRMKKKLAVEATAGLPVQSKSQLMWIPLALVVLAQAFSFYILYLNFKSSIAQRIVYQEVMTGKLKSSSSVIIPRFPWMPSLNSFAEPIKVSKARFLLNENKNQEAVDLLRTEDANPYDGRREYFMAMAFMNMKQPDSALHYAERMYSLKPGYLQNILLISQLLEQKKEYEKPASYLEAYLQHDKMNSQAWLQITHVYDMMGKTDRAWELIQEAKTYLPGDTMVEKQRKVLYTRKFVTPHNTLYSKAVDHFNSKEYRDALTLFDEFLTYAPEYVTALELRAYSLYFLKDHRRCIEAINASLGQSENIALVNLRGVCHYELQDLASACKDFEAAMKQGNADGKKNYESFCQTKAQ